MPVVIPGSPFPISWPDSVQLSAFSRINVNQNFSTFSSQQQYGDDTTHWETLAAGTGVTSFLPNESTILMSTGGTASTASIIRQTRLYNRYYPGHGLTIFQTFCFTGGATFTNNTRRIGYFDTANGVYLECAGNTISLVLRSSVSGAVVETRAVQSAWNVDTFGAGSQNPSGVTINWAMAQIVGFNIQWLGVGRLRIAFDIGGILLGAHCFNNANLVATAYMTTANLPLRLENFNTGIASGTATLRHICSAVNTDGGSETSYGKLYCANNGAAGLSIANNHTTPVLSLQAATTGPNSVRNTGQIILEQYDVAILSSNNIFWQLVLNPTLTGASFSSFGSSSIANVDTSATAYSGGTVLDAGNIAGSASAKGSQLNQSDIKTLVLAYSTLLNHQDVITLVCTSVGGITTAFCNFQWLEVW